MAPSDLAEPVTGPFDTIPHNRLMQVIGRDIADSRLLHLIEQFLQAKFMERPARWKPAMGAPQGAVRSPLLSNIYLNDLDHLMARNGYGKVCASAVISRDWLNENQWFWQIFHTPLNATSCRAAGPGNVHGAPGRWLGLDHRPLFT